MEIPRIDIVIEREIHRFNHFSGFNLGENLVLGRAHTIERSGPVNEQECPTLTQHALDLIE
jgi:hypothetical protein